METLSATFTELIKEYWYVAVAGAILAFAILVAVIIVIAKAAKSIKQNSDIKKAIKREDAEERRREEEKRARIEEDERAAALAEYDGEEPEKEEITEEETVTEDNYMKAEDKNKKEVKTKAEVKATPKAEDAEPAKKPERKAVYRVIYDGENKEWMIKKDGATRVIRRVKTKAEAMEIANRLAENQDLSLTVQKKDGKFQKKRNYNNITR